MKEITLKEACQILDKADAVIVHNSDDRLSTPLQYSGLVEGWQDWVSQVKKCRKKQVSSTDMHGRDNGYTCEEDCDSFFFVLGDAEQDDDALSFPAEHNTKVKIDADGDLLLHESDKTKSVKISVLTKKNLNP
jgi:hypothetical protein